MSRSDDATSHAADASVAEESTDMRAHAVRGAAWMMGLRWAVRLLSIVNTAILARLLTPADFGLMAMANLALAVVAVLGAGGEDLALIRLGRPTRDYLDSAWSLKIISCSIVCVCALLTAPLARLYFSSETVELIVYVISIRIILEGFVNIGTVYFRIDLDFGKEFRFAIYQKFADVIIVIPCVLIIRNVWGLAIATVAAKIFRVGLSYAMHPFRPRFRLNKAREIWSFSFWTLLVWIGNFFAGKADQYIVGAISKPAVMGAYTVGAEVAVTPSIDLVQPVMRALYPVYTRFLEEPDRLAAAAALVIGATATVCIATGLGVASVAREMTLLLLGSQWGQAAGLVFWLGIGAIPIGMNFCIYSLMQVTNNFRLTTMTVWGRLALLVPTLIVAGSWGGAPAIAAAQAGLGFVAMVADFLLLRLAIRLTVKAILGCFYRPVAAAVAMVLLLHLVGQTTSLSLFAALALKIVCGGITYIGVLMLIWVLSGRPDGIEALGLEMLGKVLRRRAAADLVNSFARRQGHNRKDPERTVA